MARDFERIGRELQAGTPLSCGPELEEEQNNRGKISPKLTYIEDRLTDCQLALAQAAQASQLEHLLDAMDRYILRREYYLQPLQQLLKSGEVRSPSLIR